MEKAQEQLKQPQWVILIIMIILHVPIFLYQAMGADGLGGFLETYRENYWIPLMFQLLLFAQTVVWTIQQFDEIDPKNRTTALMITWTLGISYFLQLFSMIGYLSLTFSDFFMHIQGR